MNLKLGYYPILDMTLALRQIYSGERFKPFIPILEDVNNKLSENEKDFIFNIGEETRGWLHFLEKVIKITADGITSPEEFILMLRNTDKIFSNKFSILWQNYFNSEIARNNKKIFEKTLSINKELEEIKQDKYSSKTFCNDINDSLKDYILKITDRVEDCGNHSVKVIIKPEHVIDFSKIQTAIVMPSIFACRNFTFWYNEQNYIFYISINSSECEYLEPSDMLLLKTLALNDKTRLKMLRMLSQNSYTTVDMANILNMNSSTVSRHFKVFKDSGFVDIFNQEGNSIYYSLNINEIKKTFSMILKYIQK